MVLLTGVDSVFPTSALLRAFERVWDDAGVV